MKSALLRQFTCLLRYGGGWGCLLILSFFGSSSESLAQQASLNPQDFAFIEVHFRAAKQYEGSNEFDKAAAEYRAILERYPEAVPRVYQNLGIVYFAQKQYAEAIQAFENGLKRDPAMPGSHLFLGNAYLFTGRPKEALPHLERAYELQRNVESATALGQVHMAHLDYESAVVYLREALSLAEADQAGNLVYLLGKAYLKLAEEIINSQTELHPESPHTHLAAAKLFESRDFYQLAAIKYLEAAEEDPMNASIFYPLARMLAILGLDDPSRLALERYRRLVPGESQVSIDQSTLPKEQVAEIGTKVDFEGILRALPEVDNDNLPLVPMFGSDVNAEIGKRLDDAAGPRWRSAIENLSQGRIQEAIRQLDLLAGSQEDWLQEYALTRAYMWSDELEKAEDVVRSGGFARNDLEAARMLRGEVAWQLSLAYFSRLMEEHPDSCWSHFIRAEHLAAREKAEAEQEFRAAIEGCPADTQIRIALADYYLANSRFEEALSACQEELRLDPYSSAAKLRIGRIYVQLLKPEDALPYLLGGIENDLENAEAHSELARAHELLKEWDKAIEGYQEALRLDPSLTRVHYVLARIYKQLGKDDLAKHEIELFKAKEAEARRQNVERIEKLRYREAGGSQPPERATPSK